MLYWGKFNLILILLPQTERLECTLRVLNELWSLVLASLYLNMNQIWNNQCTNSIYAILIRQI